MESKSLAMSKPQGAVRLAVIDAPPGYLRRTAFVVLGLVWKYEGVCIYIMLAGNWLLFYPWLRDVLLEHIGREAYYLRASLAFDTLGVLTRLAAVGMLAVMSVGVALPVPWLLRRACAALLHGVKLRTLDVEPRAHDSQPCEKKDWAARSALAVLGGSTPPTIPAGSPVSCADPSRLAPGDQTGAWSMTLVAPPSNFPESWGGEAHAKLRAFAQDALNQTAPGEVEPIAGGLVPTKLALGIGYFVVISTVIGFFVKGGWTPVTFLSMGSYAFMISFILLAAIDSGILNWARGIVYASPFTCTRVRRIGPNATIHGSAAALIVLRDWNGSGDGLVAAAGTTLPRLDSRRQPPWIRFRLTELPPREQPQKPTRCRTPAIVHALAAWSNHGHLRAIAATDALVETRSLKSLAH